MSKRRYFSRAALAIVSTWPIAACSSDAPTSPTMASRDQIAAAVAPGDRDPSVPVAAHLFCYRVMSWRVRRMSFGGACVISNFVGGGVLKLDNHQVRNWAPDNSRNQGPRHHPRDLGLTAQGCRPASIMAASRFGVMCATNSPVSVFVHFTRRDLRVPMF